ncbi:MAG TPA: VPLPA-CTERM sorting domain-containing protein [Tepidisphaeraceae bacterium]|jgi:hypothetical protein|nr:VPLPA-CTERM sorting domain-containing protein [Tepidisphaeraceae bacterium]
MSKLAFIAPITLLSAVTLAGADPVGISIQFDGTGGTPLPAGDSTGVVSLPYWNLESSNAGSGITGLADSSNSPVGGLTLQYTSAYNVTVGGTPATDEGDLYSNHLESPYSAATTGPVDSNRVAAYITGIPYASYDIYVYTSDKNSGGDVYESTTDFYTSSASIAPNSTSMAFTDASNTSTFVAGDNYVEFTGLSGSDQFLLSSDAVLSGGGGYNSGFAGIQIVNTGTPEPASVCLLMAGAAGMLMHRRRRSNCDR